MKMLGIETSCDETSVAVVEDGTRVRSCVIASSRQTFERTGGVIPEQAAREQIRSMQPVLDRALQDARCRPQDLDGIAVTRGPGLLGSLLVGTVTARTLAALWNTPIVGVHHTLGHLSSTWLDCAETPRFPLLALSASGGHTELWLRNAHTQGVLLGRTRDDAAGEAFDKGANMLSLPYPGGPSISQAGATGNPDAFPFPRPLAGEDTLDFSYSGLKTALKYTLRDLGHSSSLTTHSSQLTADLAASYENAICAHLVDRVTRALKVHPTVREIHVVGGVSANVRLKTLLTAVCEGRTLRFPVKILYCTDNAAMIAAAGTFLLREHLEAGERTFETAASLPSGTVFR